MQAASHSPLLCSVVSLQEAGAGQQLRCDPPRPVAFPSSHCASHHEGKRLRVGKRGGEVGGEKRGGEVGGGKLKALLCYGTRPSCLCPSEGSLELTIAGGKCDFETQRC